MCHSTSVQQFNDCCATGQNGVCICSMHASHCLEDIEQICSWSELIKILLLSILLECSQDLNCSLQLHMSQGILLVGQVLRWSAQLLRRPYTGSLYTCDC